MITPDDILNHKHHGKGTNALEKKMQADDLSYLASEAFSRFNVQAQEIEHLVQKVDQQTPKNRFNTLFTGFMCLLLISISIFFILFYKQQNHDSVFENTEEHIASKSLHNPVTATDTLFPAVVLKNETTEKEHYTTITDQAEHTGQTQEAPEILTPKQESLTDNATSEELVFQFVPNAPVVFIHNLKVTNYRIYYFKYDAGIDISVNTGVAAQYETSANVEQTVLSRSSNYMAHKIIQKAMKLFGNKNYSNCIEELSLLYDFNPDDANAQFYLGMCYYLTGKYTIARGFFERNLENTNNIFHQESVFYLALSLLNTNQKEEAVSLLQKIAKEKGFYSKRAEAVLLNQP